MKINTFWIIAIVIAAGAIGYGYKVLADKNKAAKLLAAAGDGTNGTGDGTNGTGDDAAARMRAA